MSEDEIQALLRDLNNVEDEAEMMRKRLERKDSRTEVHLPVELTIAALGALVNVVLTGIRERLKTRAPESFGFGEEGFNAWMSNTSEEEMSAIAQRLTLDRWELGMCTKMIRLHEEMVRLSHDPMIVDREAVNTMVRRTADHMMPMVLMAAFSAERTNYN